MSNTPNQDLFGTTDMRNISFNKSRNKWLVRISDHGKQRSLGSFDTKGEAITARDAHLTNPEPAPMPKPEEQPDRTQAPVPGTYTPTQQDIENLAKYHNALKVRDSVVGTAQEAAATEKLKQAVLAYWS